MCKKEIILKEERKEAIMTLTDLKQDMNSNNIDKTAVEAGKILKDVVSEADKDSRVVNGTHSCAVHLQHCPDNIMACILADYGPLHDVTINIEHTLLEAYCMENGIRVLKVDSSEKIKKFLGTLPKNGKYTERSGDYTCLLIKNPKALYDKAEDTLLKFDKLYKVWGWHVIEFPV
ncbi:growth arrest and DNA damage-inducible protein GADD45 gamma-like [Mytilus edulis]